MRGLDVLLCLCTWLDDTEMARYDPGARSITTGHAANHALRFHAAGDRSDRGWCHFLNTAEAAGEKALGVVFELRPEQFDENYDDFERCCVTVYGDDGKMYDCWTYRLIRPGIAMRPPNYYWQHIPTGMRKFGFPQEYIEKVMATYEAAAPCPRADRPNPSAIPGKTAASR